LSAVHDPYFGSFSRSLTTAGPSKGIATVSYGFIAHRYRVHAHVKALYCMVRTHQFSPGS
jgi:hypothetical protein